MNQNKQYLETCRQCGQVPHYIYRVNKLKGIKLICSRCAKIQTRYHKQNLLHEYSVTKLKEGGDNETNTDSG